MEGDDGPAKRDGQGRGASGRFDESFEQDTLADSASDSTFNEKDSGGANENSPECSMECNHVASESFPTGSTSPHSCTVNSGASAHMDPTTLNMKNLREYTVEIKGFSQKSSAVSTHIGDEHVMVNLKLDSSEC
eukprot:725913-Rhodomonas_salina.1